MKTSDFAFELPEQLIAKYPTEQRTASRLLHLDGVTGALGHHAFTDMLQFVDAGDLLIFNNTRVIPARLLGQKSTGGKVEVLVERMLDEHRVLAHVRASKSPKPGATLLLENAIEATMLGRHDALFELSFAGEQTVLELLEAHGHMPLPPYIEREDRTEDRDRYQTVYADRPGAVAAPTAGLHFDEVMLAQLKAQGVNTAFVTLHVGAGTFQPVRAENIAEHKMHSEWLEVTPQVVEAIEETKAAGGRVIAVGTTSVRSLESAAWKNAGVLAAYTGETDIFIYPGYQFNVIDGLVTNFHLPESTLIMLVSALAGREAVLAAYAEAVKERYRFFSYGDAMFITDLNSSTLSPVGSAQ